MEKVKAEKVNEIELKDDYNFHSVVVVKVRNKVYEVQISRERNWPEKEHKTSLKIEPSITKTFDDLGMEVDYSEIIAEYESLIPQWKDEIETARVKKAKAAYKKLWAHEAKKEIEELDSEVTATVISEKDFVGHGDMHHRFHVMEISFRGISTHLSYEDVSRSYSRYDVNMKYVICDTLTEYKRKGYKRLASLVKKFKELVDTKVAIAKSEKKAKIRKSNMLETLRKITMDGCDIEVEVNSYWSPYAGPRGRGKTVESGYKLTIRWEGGQVRSTTDDGESFSTPTNGRADLKTLKKYVAHVKSFVA